MKYLFPSLCVLVGAGAVLAAIQLWNPEFEIEDYLVHRPNVLVVSVCSLRPDRIGIYNPSFKRTPKIDEWTQGAFVLNNAVAEEPWQNFTFEASEIINRQFLSDHNYFAFRNRTAGFHFFVPPTKRTGADEEWYWSEDAILHYEESFTELKEAMLRPHEQSFYIFAHLKYMHYPYYDPVNMTEADFQKLSPKSRELLERYRKDPLKYDAQLPVVTILLNDFNLLKKKFKLPDDKTILSTSGVISDPQRTARWKQTPGYADDLNLVRELYDLKMEKFDGLAAEVLNLYNDPELQKNTVVIFTGDHGEALMEHGVLGHSVNVYEEMIRYPLIVKFPGRQAQTVHLDTQVNHQIMAKVTAGILTGEVTAANFEKRIREHGQDYVIARNCQDNIRTVRYRSEWKYIKNLITGAAELYNLKTDPGETQNLAEKNPDMAWKLEEYMIDHQADFKRITKREEISRVCL